MKLIEQAEGESVEPDYRGNEGWIMVAVGTNGGARVVDYDGKFGAFCYMMDSLCSDDPEELGLDSWPDDPGVYRGHFKVWTTSVHDYDGADNDMGFNHCGEWEDIWVPPVQSFEEFWRANESELSGRHYSSKGWDVYALAREIYDRGKGEQNG